VTTINTGELEWSGRLKFALDKIPHAYVLLLLEDYLLMKKANNTLFNNYLTILENEDPACIRIFPVPGPDKPYKNYPDIGLVSFDAPYAISTQATMWNRVDLYNFLKFEETVWELELKGSIRADELKKPILSLKNQKNDDYAFAYLCTAVYKGRWMKEADKLAKKEGILIDYHARPLETWEQYSYRKYYQKLPIPFKHVWDFLRHRVLSKF
jgi:hypothetical protein